MTSQSAFIRHQGNETLNSNADSNAQANVNSGPVTTVT